MLNNFIDVFINGLISGLGMVVIMTIFGFLTFKVMKKYILKMVNDIITKSKLKIDYTGSMDFNKLHDKPEDWRNDEK